jgi:hypothetical protein
MNEPKTTDTELLECLMGLAEKHARKVVLELQQEILPTWSTWDQNGKLEVFATPWQNDFEKHAAELFVRLKMIEQGTAVYSFINEAWATTQPTGWKPGDPFVRPMEDLSNRREMVIAIASTVREKIHRAWQIKRDSEGKAIALELETDTRHVSGWIASLLDGLYEEREGQKPSN